MIDKITDCIEETTTGKSCETEVIPASAADLRKVLKKNGWNFNWRDIHKIPECLIYKLIIKNDPQNTIQGLIGVEDGKDYIEVRYIESAPHNYGRRKKYIGVCGNLFAFACHRSFEKKFDGWVGFISKSALIEHYEKTIGAVLTNPAIRRMAIFPDKARFLVNSYYKNYFHVY